mmetsp:Transcript_22787/g.35079  ORF Transcript_22787/g.35079 Transcript_22787/m.35079 type:complete len:111 (+) Transcript_22787:5556-5888(+)
MNKRYHLWNSNAEKEAFPSSLAPLTPTVNTRVNLAPYKSQLREQEVEQQLQEEVDKRKVSEATCKIMAWVLQKKNDPLLHRRKVYFERWQLYLKNSRLAESAFEQLMESH